MNRRSRGFLILFVLAALVFSSNCQASELSTTLSRGQSIYTPVYSHIYSGNKERPFQLTVTLSIRNIDMKHTIKISKVDYYDTKGALIRRLVETPVEIKPLATLEFVIPEADTSGGSGANFIADWISVVPVNPPIFETVMIGTQSQQGISFTSRGHVIHPSR